MSVLNKMLRDLERREQRHSRTEAHSTEAAIAADDGRPLWLNLLLAFSLVLLCLAVYAILSRAVVPGAQTDSTAPSGGVDMGANSPVVSAKADNAVDKADDAVAADEKVQSAVPATEQQAFSTAVQADNTAAVTATPARTLVADTTPSANTTALAQAKQSKAIIYTANSEAKIAAATDNTVAVRSAQPNQAPPSAPAARPVTIERAGLTAAQQASALMQQALVAEQAGDMSLALTHWQQVQRLTPTQSRPYLAQARIWQMLGQTAQSVQVLQQAVAQHIVDADIQLLLAQQAATQQQWQQVTDLLPEQFALAQHPDYYGLKATALQQLGQPQAALHWFVRLVNVQPEQARWWLGAAIAYDALQQRPDANFHYQQALQRGDRLSPASRHYIQQRLTATE